MFATFDKTNFPIVKVVFDEGPNSDQEFDNFINEWINLYTEGNDFTFLFETMEMKNPHIKYALKMSQFIKRLKSYDHQFLEKSIILINNYKIRYLLDFIFLIQSPVAPVYIYNIQDEPFDIETGLINTINTIINHPNTTIIYPGRSLIPIF